MEPTYTISVAHSVLDENEMANAILKSSSDQISEGTALYLDGELTAVCSDGTALQSYLSSLLEPYEDSEDPNVTVGFNKEVTLENGIYFNESFQQENDVEKGFGAAVKASVHYLVGGVRRNVRTLPRMAMYILPVLALAGMVTVVQARSAPESLLSRMTGGVHLHTLRCPDRASFERTPEYVAAAVSACLAGREGRAYDRDLLKNAFSRSGFTSGYLNGKIDGSMFGVRSEADAELTKKTLPMLRELYRRERSRVPVTMRLEIEEGGEKLTVTDADGNKAFAYGDFEPQPARTDPTESLRRSLAKTGGTPFEAADIAVEMDGGPWFVPGSTVNELRREALDALLKKREVLRPWPTTEEHVPALPQRTLPPHRTLRARFENWEQVPERALDSIEYLILPIAQADRVPREWRAKRYRGISREAAAARQAAMETARMAFAPRLDLSLVPSARSMAASMA